MQRPIVGIAAWFVALVVLAIASGCVAPPPSSSESARNPANAPPNEVSIAVTSTAFSDGGSIPARYTCDGRGVSPPLRIDAAGNATRFRTAALEILDPDVPVPGAPGDSTFTHWLVWNLPVQNATAMLAESAVPAEARQGANSAGNDSYAPMCPPVGSPPHHYHFLAFALPAPLDLMPGASQEEFQSAVASHALANGSMVGLYVRALPVDASRGGG